MDILSPNSVNPSPTRDSFALGDSTRHLFDFGAIPFDSFSTRLSSTSIGAPESMKLPAEDSFSTIDELSLGMFTYESDSNAQLNPNQSDPNVPMDTQSQPLNSQMSSSTSQPQQPINDWEMLDELDGSGTSSSPDAGSSPDRRTLANASPLATPPMRRLKDNNGILGPVSGQSSLLTSALKQLSFDEHQPIEFLTGSLRLSDPEAIENDSFSNILKQSRWPYIPVAEVISHDDSQQAYTHYYHAKNALDWVNGYSLTDPQTRGEVLRVNFYLLFEELNEPIFMGGKLCGPLNDLDLGHTETDCLLWSLENGQPDTLDEFSYVAMLGTMLSLGSEALFRPTFPTHEQSQTAQALPPTLKQQLSHTSPFIESDSTRSQMLFSSLKAKLEAYITNHESPLEIQGTSVDPASHNRIKNSQIDPVTFERIKAARFEFCLRTGASHIVHAIHSDDDSNNNLDPNMLRLKTEELLSQLKVHGNHDDRMSLSIESL